MGEMILEQLMAGGEAAPAADLPPSIPDPEAGTAAAPEMATSTAAAPASEVETLKNMLGLADEYGRIPTVTEQERAQIEQARTILQRLLASNEKMSDQMTGATPALRKAFGGAGG